MVIKLYPDLIRRVVTCLLITWALLLLPQSSWSVAQADPSPISTPQASQPAPLSQSVPSAESRDKKGEVTVSVQALEDVMKVLTSSVPARLEANVQSLTAAEAEKYGLPANQGVIIIWLDPKGPLGRAGLRISDIILQIDNQPIESLERFVTLVNSLGPLQTTTFSVLDHRTGRIRTVKMVVGVSHRAQQPSGGFFSRNYEAAVAGIKQVARTVEQQVTYATERGVEAVGAAYYGLRNLVGKTDKEPVNSAKKRARLQ
jgi:hypothetical protein